MARKKTPINIPIAPPIDRSSYVTWEDNEVSRSNAIKKYGEGVEEFVAVNRTNASRYRQSFENIDGLKSGRPGLTNKDYDVFRPDESVSTNIKEITYQCNEIYNTFGLVKNVIDLMGDFASQGIRVVHPNRKQDKFFRNWFKKVGGPERSERFLNTLYRLGNVVINRQTAKISVTVAKQMSANAAADMIINSGSDTVTEKREIPWKYTFINPGCVDIIGGSLASFVNKKIYGISLPSGIRRSINSPKEAEQLIVSQLPQVIIDAAKSKKPFPLDPNKTIVYHYKKDDWASWAYPMIYSILDDIIMIDKLKLADKCALDGAISNIRIFKLGNLEHKIAPLPAAAQKLNEILQSNVGGGTIDLVWGPDIELMESKTQVHQFLGEAKYIPHLNSIYAGLGIPPTLTGTFGAAGTTNNFISLKTLTQRLQYGRRVLTDFWMNEIEIVRKAMGFDKGAKIEFDRMDLSNEDAEKALLIQLADRNIASDEIIQRIFGLDPEIEQSRIGRETKARKSKKMSPKAGPYFDGGNFENAVKKLAVQLGIATVGQAGIALDEKLPGEKTALEMKAKFEPKKEGPVGVSGQGRPKTKKDTQKRKARKFAPKTGASLNLWAIDAQEKISEVMNPILLDYYNKRNMRSLTNAEYEEAEQTKTKLFFSLTPFSEINTDNIQKSLANLNSDNILKLYACYKKFVGELRSGDKPLTMDEIRYTKAYIYSSVYSSDN